MKSALVNLLSRHPDLKRRVKAAVFRAGVMLNPSFSEKARAMAYDHALFREVIKFNANKNGREIYSFITLQHVFRALDVVGAEPGGAILEIGAGRTGLPILLLLAGFDEVVVNEFSALDQDYDRNFVESVYLLSVLTGRNRRVLSDIVETRGDRVTIRPEFVRWMPFTDAATLDLPQGYLRAVVSFTVLEHIENIVGVIEHTASLLDDKGWMCHVVDMRDHDDFADPLAFLRPPSADYRPHHGAWCNRLRHSDLVALFERAGLQLASSKVTTFNKLDNRKSNDFWEMSAEGMDVVFTDRLSEGDVWVTEEMRQTFSADYRAYALDDLSILQSEYVLTRKNPNPL